MILVTDEGEILPEGKDEILNIMDNGILHHPLIHILLISDSQFLHIDIIQKIFILECVDGTESLLRRRKCLQKVVWQAAPVVIVICCKASF